MKFLVNKSKLKAILQRGFKMISPTVLLIISTAVQCILTIKVVKKLITPKLNVVDPTRRFTTRLYFIEADRKWVWAVFDTKHNDFARSSGYFQTFSQESDANNLAKLYERTGGPVQ